MTEQAKVPAIRFAGFTDPWEQRKLGEIVSIGAGAPPSAFSAGNFLYVKVDDLNESSHFQFDSAQRVDANTAVKPIRKGSIIFAKRGAAILGNKVRVLGKTAYIDTNMMALEPRGVDADYGCSSIRPAFIGSQILRPFRRSITSTLSHILLTYQIWLNSRQSELSSPVLMTSSPFISVSVCGLLNKGG